MEYDMNIDFLSEQTIWRINMINDLMHLHKYESPEKHIERARVYEYYIFEDDAHQAEIIHMEIVK